MVGTLGMAAYTTWIKDVSKVATVFYFVGNCNAAIGNFPGKVVCLDTPDAYPPQRKVFLMWTYVRQLCDPLPSNFVGLSL